MAQPTTYLGYGVNLWDSLLPLVLWYTEWQEAEATMKENKAMKEMKWVQDEAAVVWHNVLFYSKPLL